MILCQKEQRCIHLRIASCSPKELLEIKKSDDINYFSQRYGLLKFNFTFTGICGAFAKCLTLSKQELFPRRIF